MQRIKWVGAITTAILVAFAITGVGSAAATRLCSTNTLPCSNILESGTKLKSELTEGNEAIFTSGFAVIKCKTSTMEEKTTSAGGSEGVAVSGEITTATSSNCTCNLGGSVTAKAEALPWSTQLSYTEGMNGTTNVSNLQWSLVCIETQCVYSVSSASFTITGGTPAMSTWTITLNLIPALSDFPCPSTMTMKILYKLGNIAAPTDGVYVAPH